MALLDDFYGWPVVPSLDDLCQMITLSFPCPLLCLMDDRSWHPWNLMSVLEVSEFLMELTPRYSRYLNIRLSLRNQRPTSDHLLLRSIWRQTNPLYDISLVSRLLNPIIPSISICKSVKSRDMGFWWYCDFLNSYHHTMKMETHSHS